MCIDLPTTMCDIHQLSQCYVRNIDHSGGFLLLLYLWLMADLACLQSVSWPVAQTNLRSQHLIFDLDIDKLDCLTVIWICESKQKERWFLSWPSADFQRAK